MSESENKSVHNADAVEREAEKWRLIFKTCSEPTLLNNLPKDIACEIISLVRQATINEMENKSIKISNINIPEKKLIEFIKSNHNVFLCCLNCKTIGVDKPGMMLFFSNCKECNNEVLCRTCLQKPDYNTNRCNECLNLTCEPHLINKDCVYCGKTFKMCTSCERHKGNALCGTC